MSFPKRAGGRKGNNGGGKGRGSLIVAGSSAIRYSAAGAAPIECNGRGTYKGIVDLVVGGGMDFGNFVGISG